MFSFFLFFSQTLALWRRHIYIFTAVIVLFWFPIEINGTLILYESKNTYRIILYISRVSHTSINIFESIMNGLEMEENVAYRASGNAREEIFN